MRLKLRDQKIGQKYRLVIFDIPALSRVLRDILGRKLKEWDFYPLQKSVWIHAFNCKEEIDLLREFLGLSKNRFWFWKLQNSKEIIFLENISKFN